MPYFYTLLVRIFQNIIFYQDIQALTVNIDIVVSTMGNRATAVITIINNIAANNASTCFKTNAVIALSRCFNK